MTESETTALDLLIAQVRDHDRRSAERDGAISAKIDNVRSEVSQLRTEVARHAVTMQHHDVRIRQAHGRADNLEQRVTALERWKVAVAAAWATAGGAAYAGFQRVSDLFGFGGPS